MAAPIGALLVELAASTASFQQDMGKAAQIVASTTTTMGRSLAGIERQFGLVTKAAGLFGVSLGAGAIVAFSRATLDSVGGLGEMAEQLGVSTDALQAYQFAAAQAGVKNTELEAGLARLTKTIGDARDGASDAVQIIRRFGGEVEALVASGASTDEVLRAVANRIAATEDAAKRGALAYDAFGRSGQKLLPILSGGAAGLDRFMAEARSAGQVLDKELIDRFDKASDKIAVWQRTLTIKFAEGLDGALQIVQNPKYAPVMAALGYGVGRLALGPLGGAFAGGVVIGAQLAEWTSKAEEASVKVERLRQKLSDLTDALYREQTGGGAPPVIRALQENVRRAREELAAAETELDQFNRKIREANTKSPDLEGVRGFAMSPKGSQAVLVSNEEKALVARMQAQVETFGKAEAAVLRYRLEKEKDANGNPKYSQSIIDQAVALQQRLDVMKATAEMQAIMTQRATEAAATEEQNRRDAKERAAAIIKQKEEIGVGLQREVEENESLIRALGEGNRAYQEQVNLLRIQQQYRAAGIPLIGAELDAAKKLAAQLTEQERTIQRKQQALQDLENFGERAFDRLGQAATIFGRDGEDAFLSMRNVARAVIVEIQEELMKLAVLNPLKNWIFGTNKPTLGDFGGGGGSFLPGGDNIFSWIDKVWRGFPTFNSIAGTSNFVTSFATNAGFSSLMMGFADGTPNAPRGWAMVGEDGPELVNFRGGERVFDNATSMDMLRGGGDTYYIDAKGADPAAIARLEAMIARVNGSIEPRALSVMIDSRGRGGPVRENFG